MHRDQQYFWALIVTGSVLLSGCAAMTKGRADLDLGIKERGIASWYGDDFHGWVMASGEPYDMYAFTAAHRTLPLGTVARITNVVNGNHVMVRIIDRGPYVNGRILDLSYAAANALGMLGQGVSAIHLEVVAQGRVDIEVNGGEQRTGGMLGIPDRPLETMPVPNIPNIAKDETYQAKPGIRPMDMLRERRTRRVGDVMAAERRVEVIAESAFV
jgi:rare lipoprotein A